MELVARALLNTPIGRLSLTANDRGLAAVDLLKPDAAFAAVEGSSRAAAHLHAATGALCSYFEGAAHDFSDVSLAPEGTPFQLAVWAALRKIPYGTTVSYQQLAERILRPRAVRALGLANGRNPLPIVVPCHRVIGAGGTLTGFGLGVPVKAWLLVHEGAAQPFGDVVTSATRVEPVGTSLF